MSSKISITKDELVEGVVQEIYSSDVVQEAFTEAWELYPDYNEMGEDTERAVDHIVSAADNHFPLMNVDEIREKVSENIYAGLTWRVR